MTFVRTKLWFCHAISHVVTYSTKKSLVWLIDESAKVILKETIWFEEAT